MLTAQQIDHFKTFGFVVLRDFLGDGRTEALRTEVDTALHDAYVATYDERIIDGISGHYVPMTSRLTPVSATLVCDDPIFIEAAGQLLGAPVLPGLPEGILYFAEAGWHNDDGIGVQGVKFAAYFDALDENNGALRFVPCSHYRDAVSHLRSYQAASYTEVPAFVAGTRPGDVVAFDLHIFHGSFGGRDRLAWATEYVAAPGTEEDRVKVCRWMTDSFEQRGRGFDHTRYPVWQDWLTGAPGPRRAVVIERLRAAGILDLPGAYDGW
jgi:Phytanoyl-CoA dioxygenase (PhyH)